ncbi:cyclic nucleotide-binding domain-containing protein [Alcanivorax quisquiliarum]|uniref:Cyclic nucleotide-binding domain-containing protein n=1 Tax=Alcanivorax quisquiliarum TaxID=2933565 RepID=A0ABT0E401_9GAMM|nr:cyclic nucleotide-binding domain-containing protein [Alcanivorax quisquiliarum]MCK0536536.1 cyclic nucleotide-binding domain-containing protein [Alcanivorax quisquiliarum]
MSQGTSIDKRLLQTFVPVNALSGEHLDRLLDLQQVRHYRRGEVLFDVGDTDNMTVYLLSGEVTLADVEGGTQEVSAGGIESWHPLDHCQPRRRRATAATDVSVVCFDSARLDALLAWDQSVRFVMHDIQANAAYESDREWMTRLLRSRLFYRVPPGNIFEIFRRLRQRKHKAGEAIIHQGEEADCCFIIKEGMCEVSVRAPGALEATPVAILETGQWFGEEALLAGAPRNATVSMATDGVLMRLDRPDFDQLLREPVVDQVGADEASRRIAEGARWLDVRTADEYEQQHLPGALNLPLSVLRLKSRLLDPSRPYIAYCDTGRRSASAVFLLRNAGIEVQVMEGGLNGNPLLAGAAG